MIKYLKKISTPVKITTFGLIAFLSNLVLKLWSVPHIKKSTGGLTSFDLSIKGYDFTYVSNYLNKMSEDLIYFYSYRQIPIDIIFPVSTAIFSLLLIAYFSKKIKVKTAFYIFPILCCLFDLIENFFIFKLLNHSFNNNTVILSSTFTKLKFVTGIFYTLLIIGLFIKYKKESHI